MSAQAKTPIGAWVLVLAAYLSTAYNFYIVGNFPYEGALSASNALANALPAFGLIAILGTVFIGAVMMGLLNWNAEANMLKVCAIVLVIMTVLNIVTANGQPPQTILQLLAID